MTSKKFSHIVPFLHVRDLQETIAYYRDKLGFYHEWFWGEKDAGIERDDIHLLFNLSPEYIRLANKSDLHFEFIWFVKNVDGIYKEYQKKGVEILREIEDKPWGGREFTIFDINGYSIRIAEGKRKKTEINSDSP